MKLPPLNALRAFDAVARLGSVRDAAALLFVTPAAVTQQCRHLESALGATLLQKRGRSIALTDAGRQLHANTTRHLRALAQAADAVRPQRNRVRVSTLPTFAAHWLIPMLKGFTAKHPDIDVQIEVDMQLIDLEHGQWDLAIRGGQGAYPRTKSALLFDLHLMPVASPDYIKRWGGPSRSRWPTARLLHDMGFTWWASWFEQARISGVDTSQGLYFSYSALVIAAALEGQGVALVPRPYIEQELTEHRLVVLDKRTLALGTGMYAVWSTADGIRLSDTAKKLCDWLVLETAPYRA